jgi:competence ComEA-like helix-hairpin-helix protein
MIDLNGASAEALKTLKGIGQTKAEAIVKYRELHGPFQSLTDLTKVPGIGSKVLEDNASILTLGSGVTGQMKGTGTSQKGQMKSAGADATKHMTGATEKAKQGPADQADKAKQGIAKQTDKGEQGLTQLGNKAGTKSKIGTSQAEDASKKATTKIKGIPLTVK